MVALHGCRQSADDFAAGTQLDVHADAGGFAVLYPEQDERANGHRCWNWFLPENQRRDGPEPSQVVALVRRVLAEHHADPGKVFLCGLSAGASAAAVLLEQAPEIFAGAALMAGIPLHAADDAASAYAAMRGERAPDSSVPPAMNAAAYGRSRAMIWTGRDDARVVPANSWRLAVQLAALYGLRAEPDVAERLDDGVRAHWHDSHGRLRIELREIGGVGHAWSGGSLRGSYTAPNGPNLTAEMVRFFLSEPASRLSVSAGAFS